MAYSPDKGKTAIRAAYRHQLFPGQFRRDGRNARAELSVLHTEPLNYTHAIDAILESQPGLTGAYDVPYTPGGTLTPPPGFGVFFVAKNFKQDEAQVWNFSIERQLPANMMISAAYVGTHGVHLYRDLQLNQRFRGRAL